MHKRVSRRTLFETPRCAGCQEFQMCHKFKLLAYQCYEFQSICKLKLLQAGLRKPLVSETRGLLGN